MGWDLFSLALLCALAALLLSAAIEDLRIREIADWKNIAIAVLAPLFWWSQGLALWPDIALQLALGLVVFLVFAGAFALGQMGGGDVKMLGAVALWFPWTSFVTLLMVMAIAGGVITVIMLIERRAKQAEGQPEIPYGVAIAFAGLVSLHQPILNHLS